MGKKAGLDEYTTICKTILLLLYAEQTYNGSFKIEEEEIEGKKTFKQLTKSPPKINKMHIIKKYPHYHLVEFSCKNTCFFPSPPPTQK